MEVVRHVGYSSLLLAHFKNLSMPANTSSMVHSELAYSRAMCFLVSVESLLNINEVSSGPYDSDDFPNDDRALMCCSIES